MKIKSLYLKSYGKFENKKIEFSDSLNVIYGNNEAGKSTVMSFIKAMLYGFEGKGNDLLTNDRKKYVPWNGRNAAGEADIITDAGENIRIIREMGKSRRQDTLQAVNINNGEEYDYIPSGVVGIGEDAFMKFFYIRSAGSRLSGENEEIAQRLINLAYSGSQDLNYRAAADKLLEEMKKFKALKGSGGRIGELEKKINDLNEELRQAEEYRRKFFDLAQRQRELEAETKKCDAALDRIKEESEKSAVYDKYILLERCGEELKVLKKQYDSVNGEAQACENKIKNLSAYENTPDEIIFQSVPDLKPQSKMSKIMTILAAGGTAAFAVLTAYNVFSLIPAAICAAMLVFLLNNNALSKREAERVRNIRLRVERELEKFGANDAKDYFDKKSEYEQEKHRLKTLEERISGLGTRIREEEKRAIEIREDIGDIPKPDNVRTSAQLAADEKIADTALKEILIEKSRIEGLLAAPDSEHRTPDIILTDRAEVKDEYDRAVIRHSALNAAYEALNTAYSRMSSDFTPAVNKKASEILKQITGKYDDIIANKDFSVIINSSGAKQLASFSSGTIDQVYMALRLAVTDIIFGCNKPLFIDDAFLLYDKEREGNLLRYLEGRAADGQQIIVFSCKKLEVSPAANIISLT